MTNSSEDTPMGHSREAENQDLSIILEREVRDPTLIAMATAAIGAGDLIMDNFVPAESRDEAAVEDQTIQYKDELQTQASAVTETDKASQARIVQILKTALEESGVPIGFLGEEELRELSNKERIYVIDPLDGTTNFIFGISYFAVSIAEMTNGVTTRGVIFNPITRVLYFAGEEDGTYRLDLKTGDPRKELKTKKLDLARAPKCVHFNRPETYRLAEALHFLTGQTENGGSIVLDLCRLLENASLVINTEAYTHDLAAAEFMLRKVGIEMRNLVGYELTEFKPTAPDADPNKEFQIVAGHPEHLEAIRSTVINSYPQN